MKKLFFAFILGFIFLSPTHAQEDGDVVLVPLTEICDKFGEFSIYMAINYLEAGAGKEVQLKHFRENAFTKLPALTLFEPGIIKTLDVLEASKETFDATPKEDRPDLAERFANAVIMACLVQEADGWLRQAE